LKLTNPLNGSLRLTPKVTTTIVELAALFAKLIVGVGLGDPVAPVISAGTYKYPNPVAGVVNTAVKFALYVPAPVLGCGLNSVRFPN
jgi:hypothetical protein